MKPTYWWPKMTLINFMFSRLGGPRCKEARLGTAGQPLAARRRSHKKHPIAKSRYCSMDTTKLFPGQH